MEFKVQCPSCNATLKLRDKSLLGKAIRCPKCQKAVKLPVDSGSKTSAARQEAKAAKRPKKEIVDPWESVTEDDEEFHDDEVDSSFGSEFDDELLDFGDGNHESFADPYTAAGALPPRRTTKAAKSKRVEKAEPEKKPFPWKIVAPAIAGVCVIGLLIPLILSLTSDGTGEESAGNTAQTPSDTARGEADETPVATTAGPARDLRKIRNQMKNIGIAFHNFHDVYQGFPFWSQLQRTHPEWFDKDGKPLLSWRVHMLPFVGQEALFNQFHMDEAWDSDHNKTLLDRMPDVYRTDQSSAKPSETCLMMPAGKGTIMEDGKGCALVDIRDGTSNTLLLVLTDASRAVPWTNPSDYDVPPGEELSGLYFLDGTTVVAFCDGSAQFLERSSLSNKIAEGADTSVISALFSRSGLEQLPKF